MSRSPRLLRYDAPDSVIRAAGAWLARRDRGLNATEQAEFAAWREARAEHAAAVAQLERTMLRFDGLQELAPSIGGRPDPDALARPGASARIRGWRMGLGLGLALGAAAAVAILFLDPRAASGPASRKFASATTAGERVELADGSRVTLNRDTQLEVEFTPHGRQVRLLRGEAHFAVAKDPARPFTVITAQVAARAVGTAFNVRLDAAGVEVLVTEGRVQVAPASKPGADAVPEAVVLMAGFRAVIAATPDPAGARPVVGQLTDAEIARQLAWRPRLIDLRDAPLADIVAEFNRRAHGAAQPRLVIGDPAIADLRLGGMLYPEEPEPFLRLLEKSFGIRSERRGATITLSRAP